MRVYGDSMRFFREGLVVGVSRQNQHRSFQHDALTAARTGIVTNWRWDSTHITESITALRQPSPTYGLLLPLNH